MKNQQWGNSTKIVSNTDAKLACMMFYQTIWYDSKEDQYSKCEYEPQYTKKGRETQKSNNQNLITDITIV